MKNIKIIIAIILVCVMVLGVYTDMKPVANEPDANGIGHISVPEMTEADWQEYRIKYYENKYGISEEKKQEYRETQIYPDVLPGMWYTEAINAMTDGGLLNGYTDGLFHPDDYVTQGQFAKVLCEYYDMEPVEYTSILTDCWFHEEEHTLPVTAHWAMVYAMDATYGGYTINICPSTLDEPLWRGDALNEICSSVAWSIPKYYRDHKQIYQTEKVWTLDDIPDADELNTDLEYKEGPYHRSDEYRHGHWFSDGSILEAYNIGATQGIDEFGTCAPRQPMTRAELCQMLYNLGVTQKGQAEGYYHREHSIITTGFPVD